MSADSGTVSAARPDKTDDFRCLQELVIFCGAGLLLSLIAATGGWM